MVIPRLLLRVVAWCCVLVLAYSDRTVLNVDIESGTSSSACCCAEGPCSDLDLDGTNFTAKLAEEKNKKRFCCKVQEQVTEDDPCGRSSNSSSVPFQELRACGPNGRPAVQDSGEGAQGSCECTCAANYDPQAQCAKCLKGWRFATNCTSCAYGFDAAQTCGQCRGNRDDECKLCSNGFGLLSGCKSCLPNYVDEVCTQCKPGFDIDHKCQTCLKFFDPMAGCSRCIQGHTGDKCNQCLPGFEPGNGKCVKKCDPSKAGDCWKVFVIGDTHGDEGYLVHSLLSTGHFDVSIADGVNHAVNWKPTSGNDFEIVVLGDIVDRGSRSLKCLRLLRKLGQEDSFGRLKVILGNHEAMLLQHIFQDATEGGDLDWAVLTMAHGGKDPRGVPLSIMGNIVMNDYFDFSKAGEPLHSSKEILAWLRMLPVIYMTHGVLMMHGGLSLENLQLAIQITAGIWGKQPKACFHQEGKKPENAKCGSQVIDRINHMARYFFQLMRDCTEAHYDDQGQQEAEGAPQSVRHDEVGLSCMRQLQMPVLEAADSKGVLWERRFTGLEYGANIKQVCQEAKKVAWMLGAWTMVGAHNTHPQIQLFCAGASGAGVPVYAVDTHWMGCEQRAECDFDNSGYLQQQKVPGTMWPQSLAITIMNDGSRTIRKHFSTTQGVAKAEISPYVMPMGGNAKM